MFVLLLNLVLGLFTSFTRHINMYIKWGSLIGRIDNSTLLSAIGYSQMHQAVVALLTSGEYTEYNKTTILEFNLRANLLLF